MTDRDSASVTQADVTFANDIIAGFRIIAKSERFADASERHWLAKDIARHRLATTPPSAGDELDAARWRAFVSSARFKMIGSANFDHSAYPEVSLKANRDPREGLHFGLEVWDKHPAGDDEQGVHGRNLLMAYVDARVAAAPPPPAHGAMRAENERLREALCELADLVDDAISDGEALDSFTTQPARAALAETRGCGA